MKSPKSELTRRAFLRSAAALGVTAALAPWPAQATSIAELHRRIPSTGEVVPAVGMGSWITFNVGNDKALRDERVEVLRTFFEMGGGVIDSSPMYGSSEEVIGYCLSRLDHPRGLFSATKVWTLFQGDGVDQMAHSRELWGVRRFDLMQIHNLMSWESHLETLLEDKAAGRIRYIGVTTSHGRRHDELEEIMRTQPIDFVQLTYNIVDREAEERLLPLAGTRNLGVVINRPFRRKELFHRFAEHPLPPWAREIDCVNWAQFFLKFVISHPNVTCAIPATSRADHMAENMGALYGRQPNWAMRQRMIRYVESL